MSLTLIISIDFPSISTSFFFSTTVRCDDSTFIIYMAEVDSYAKVCRTSFKVSTLFPRSVIVMEQLPSSSFSIFSATATAPVLFYSWKQRLLMIRCVFYFNTLRLSALDVRFDKDTPKKLSAGWLQYTSIPLSSIITASGKLSSTWVRASLVFSASICATKNYVSTRLMK